jgi:hypothetical protein
MIRQPGNILKGCLVAAHAYTERRGLEDAMTTIEKTRLTVSGLVAVATASPEPVPAR